MRTREEVDAALALARRGLPDGEIARRTGIPRTTVSGWRRGKDLIRLRQGGDDPHGCSDDHDFSGLPPDHYAYLLGLYLGDGCISAGRRGVWRMRITLDAAYPAIIEECCRGLEAIFPMKTARVGARSDSRCVEVSMWSKHWPCLIPQHGPGRKHLRSIQLTAWQSEIVGSNPRPFIRGLIHSDGTRIIATERRGSYTRHAPRYAFSNRSEDIKKLFCDSCDALGIRWTRPTDCQIAIYRLASVAILDEFVGPKR